MRCFKPSQIVFCILLPVLSITYTKAQVHAVNEAIVRYSNTHRFNPETGWLTAMETRIISAPSLRNQSESQLIALPDHSRIIDFYHRQPESVELEMPVTINQKLQLQLIRETITSGSELQVTVFNDSGVTYLPLKPALHYRGIIKGRPKSLVALSLFEEGNFVMLITDSSANYSVGEIPGSAEYSIYNSVHLQLPATAVCGVDDNNPMYDAYRAYQLPLQTEAPPLLCKKVRCYWEANYNLYRYTFDSNMGNMLNYLNGIFNIVATLYANEGIRIELSGLGVWTSADPYRITTSSTGLDDFKKRWNAQSDAFPGDIAHLVAGGPTNNGGLGYVNVLCYKSYAYSYSNVWGYYYNLPTWSWDANVLTHEMGHNLGSKHTHWCGWNTGSGGTCGAIDNCYTVESSGSCTTCSSTTNISALPAGWKGTIMSYCHNVSGVGIDLANGFGPLPQQTIRNSVSTNLCLTSLNSWSGSTDSLWSRSANWNCSSLPDSTTDVSISTGSSNMPVITSTAYAKSITVETGSTLKIKLPGSLRVKAPSTAPNTVAMPASGKLFITGSATPAGWMNNGDAELKSQQFTQAGNSMYVGRSMYLSGGSNNYLLVPVYGNWTNKYGYTGAANTNNTTTYNFIAEGADILAPPTAGYYHLFADFALGKVTLNVADPKVTIPASGELYITGNATPAGWMANGAAPVAAQKFTQISSTLYELSSIYLTAGNSYLLVPVYGSYTSKYGGVDRINNRNQLLEDDFQIKGSDLKAPDQSGNYKIRVDFQTGRFTLTAL